jgi:hypothetical protein
LHILLNPHEYHLVNVIGIRSKKSFTWVPQKRERMAAPLGVWGPAEEVGSAGLKEALMEQLEAVWLA